MSFFDRLREQKAREAASTSSKAPRISVRSLEVRLREDESIRLLFVEGSYPVSAEVIDLSQTDHYLVPMSEGEVTPCLLRKEYTHRDRGKGRYGETVPSTASVGEGHDISAYLLSQGENIFPSVGVHWGVVVLSPWHLIVDTESKYGDASYQPCEGPRCPHCRQGHAVLQGRPGILSMTYTRSIRLAEISHSLRHTCATCGEELTMRKASCVACGYTAITPGKHPATHADALPTACDECGASDRGRGYTVEWSCACGHPLPADIYTVPLSYRRDGRLLVGEHPEGVAALEPYRAAIEAAKAVRLDTTLPCNLKWNMKRLQIDENPFDPPQGVKERPRRKVASSPPTSVAPTHPAPASPSPRPYPPAPTTLDDDDEIPF